MTSAPAAEPARNRALGVLRLLVVWAAGVGLAMVGEPTPATWWLGLALAALGESVRVWAAGYLVKTKELITGGPYRFVRNPLYLGRLLILGGLAVAARKPPYYPNLWVLGFGMAVFFFYYMPRKERTEPRRLEQVHGEPYRRYFEAVPSILPRLTPYDRPQGSWKWANFGKNEEAMMVAALAAFFGALAWRNPVL